MDAASLPIRRFMSEQIERTENADDVWLFYRYLPASTAEEPKTYDDVPLVVLLPAFMLSELKTAFLIGFQIYLPFLVLDIVVASVTISMGMMMLPPVLISLPFKLLLFVLVDGWHLVVEMLVGEFSAVHVARSDRRQSLTAFIVLRNSSFRCSIEWILKTPSSSHARPWSWPC